MGFPESHVGMELGYSSETTLRSIRSAFWLGLTRLLNSCPISFVAPMSASCRGRTCLPERCRGTRSANKSPALSVEVLSPSNTRGEIARKLKEYFFAGVVLAWIIDPVKVKADIYTAPDAKTTIDASGVLDGGDVLPGFRVPLAKLFEQLADAAPAKKPPEEEVRPPCRATTRSDVGEFPNSFQSVDRTDFREVEHGTITPPS